MENNNNDNSKIKRLSNILAIVMTTRITQLIINHVKGWCYWYRGMVFGFVEL